MTDPIAFATPKDLDAWLAANHDRETELWVKLYKKASGIPSITWGEMVEAALCWGWIDGLKRSHDDVSYLQRLTPRKPRSNWSKANVAHVERLISEGRMQPAGLVHVDAARADGRWEAAYAGPADMVIPDDFLAAVAANPAAKATYDALTRSWLYSIYHQLHSARKPETRAARMDRMIARMAQGEPPVKR
ncbi:YdeI/OmpD-associated family protein [Maritimibacter dapengensis]|uniref:YdeI/OmpD-associated family protein n=1 Tax=Maritimibacter dapengensis TaxID=2836868 RepID=A0ABS6T597_9RHOB|nr:YdeI/OmpD-associated family protein [Maritimibacter dapengensis]MBV7379721.1 YdeI/OmpD-associated family protein [Maritimibacter dapengensis]